MRPATPFTAWHNPLLGTGQLLGAELGGRPAVIRPVLAPVRGFAAYDAEDGSLVREFALDAGFTGGPQCRMHLDAGGERPVLVALESRGLRGTVVQVDLVTGERACPDTWGKRRKPWGRRWPRMSAVVPHRGEDGRRTLLLGWSDGRVDRVDAVTGEAAGPRMRGTGRAQVWSLAAFTAADGAARLAGADADGLLRIWDVATGRRVGDPVKAHNGPVSRLVPYRADGRMLLATGGTDHSVRIWDPESRTPLGRTMVHPENTLGLCAYRADGRPVLAVASNRLHRYDALTGQPVGEPVDGWEEDACLAVCAVRVGDRVALFGADEIELRRFDGATGEEWPAERPWQQRDL
ncbi:WD40 repeat domain-containing protein [Kitasatospora sp. NPDC093550]|uniref:WD40 repeat domain-containing protein n=1 Tax=Kitasatospora sp. NPDC093550 TaxID=3364089 RepID=UPI00380268B7